MAYEVVLSPTADKAIGGLPKEIRARIIERLLAISQNPRARGSIKLSGQDAYRVRVGDYRIIYKIQDSLLIVLVVDVGHRRDVYE